MRFYSASTEPPMPLQRGAPSGGTAEVPQGLVHAIDRATPDRTVCGNPVGELYEVAVDFASVVDGRCVCCSKTLEAR